MPVSPLTCGGRSCVLPTRACQPLQKQSPIGTNESNGTLCNVVSPCRMASMGLSLPPTTPAFCAEDKGNPGSQGKRFRRLLDSFLLLLLHCSSTVLAPGLVLQAILHTALSPRLASFRH